MLKRSIDLAGRSAANGHVATGFEPVRALFESELIDHGRGGSAFCAYVGGEPVVDLWAGEARPDVPWAQDTLTTVFSATKGMAALCAQILSDRGELDVDAPVARYWPAFAQAGKERALVRHVLSHTVGVLGMPDAGSLLDWSGRGWGDYEQIAARLAAAEPAWEPGTKVGYHAVTYGWLVGELVRRITGKTIGTFFHDEVATPLDLDLWLGTPPQEHPRCADLFEHSTDGMAADDAFMFRAECEQARHPETLSAQAGIAMHGSSIGDHMVTFFTHPRVREVEIAASNASGTAHALARMYAMLSMGGELDGARIVSPESIAEFSTEAAIGPNATWPWNELRLPSGNVATASLMRWALGYGRDVPDPDGPTAYGPVDEAFGMGGFGGQVAFCDPVNRIAVGYLRNHLSLASQDASKLIDALYDCAGIAT
jgi:CubicO group peptidase (beta-lactamase class C family)